MIARRQPTAEQTRLGEEEARRAGPEAAARPTCRSIYAERTLRLAESPPSVPVPLQVLRIGDVCIGTMPCEVFCEIGLEFKKRSPLQPAFLVSLAHGYSATCPRLGTRAGRLRDVAGHQPAGTAGLGEDARRPAGDGGRIETNEGIAGIFDPCPARQAGEGVLLANSPRIVASQAASGWRKPAGFPHAGTLRPRSWPDPQFEIGKPVGLTATLPTCTRITWWAPSTGTTISAPARPTPRCWPERAPACSAAGCSRCSIGHLCYRNGFTCSPGEQGVEGPAIIGAYGLGLQGSDMSCPSS